LKEFKSLPRSELWFENGPSIAKRAKLKTLSRFLTASA
jgi:hypothetical protein